MLKVLAIFALSLFILPVQTYAQTDKAKQASKSDKPPSPTAPVVQQHTDSPGLHAEQGKHVQDDVWVIRTPEKDGWDKAAFGISVMLTLIGLGGVIYARKTLKAIEGQLDEIKAAGVQTDKMIANAGKQADAAINAARPFVMIEATRTGDFFQFRAINYGKSPAKIVFYQPITTFDPVRIGEELPDQPHYGFGYDNDQMEVINVQWLAPTKDMEVGSFNLGILRNDAPEIYEDLNKGRRLLYLYSAVKYRGILEDRVYKSTFCYLAVNGGLRMAGPYGYNQYT